MKLKTQLKLEYQNYEIGEYEPLTNEGLAEAPVNKLSRAVTKIPDEQKI